MSPSLRGRAASRVLVSAAAAAVVLSTASSAQAALGPGAPAAFSNRPNLQSVTFSGRIASFVFDRPITLTSQGTTAQTASQFQIGGYRSGFVIPQGAHTPMSADASVTAPNTVLVTYGGSSPDFNASTFGTVAPGAVRGVGTFNNPNLTDTTRITGASGETGTRGHTAGPDIVSVAVDINTNRINYTFDQNVGTAVAGSFGYINANGDTVTGDGVVATGNPVSVQFNAPKQVDSARQAFITAAAVPAQDAGGAFNANASVPIPGLVAPATALTLRPTVTGAEINAASGTILYSFDQPIALVGAVQAGGALFQAVAANGSPIPGTSATVVNGGGLNQVLVTFPTSQFSEQIVYGSASAGAATATNPMALTNPPTGKPVGGNAGAKATGYSSAPDAVAATFNATSGQVVVTFDARLTAANAANYSLIADDGTVIANGATTATVETTTGPSQVRVFLQFIPQSVAVSKYLLINGNQEPSNALNDFSTLAGNAAALGTVPVGAPGDNQNLVQLITPTTTTASFKTTGR